MAVTRVKKMPGFFCDDVVLLAADREGVEAFERALTEAKKENVPSHLLASGTSHEFYAGGSETRAKLDKRRVIRRLTEKKASKILDNLWALKASTVSLSPICQYE